VVWLAGDVPSLLVALGLLGIVVALVVAAVKPRFASAPFLVALACGLLIGSTQVFESRLAGYDPMPRWGQRVREECASGCDVSLYRLHAYSLDFYSGLDWTIAPNLGGDFPSRLRHDRGFLVLPTDQEGALAQLPFRWEVLDRSPILDKSWLAAALGRGDSPFRSVSLVRFERNRT
jgi:hypothetical protein